MVFPDFASDSISVMTLARVAASWQLSQIACMRMTDLALVSGLEDLEADKVEGMSLAGKMDEMSIPGLRSNSAVTT